MQKSVCLSKFRTESKPMQNTLIMSKKKVISKRSVAFGFFFFPCTHNTHQEKFNAWIYAFWIRKLMQQWSNVNGHWNNSTTFNIPLTQLKNKAELYLNTYTKVSMPLQKNKALNFNKERLHYSVIHHFLPGHEAMCSVEKPQCWTVNCLCPFLAEIA